jgi:hypothetical protein
VSQIQSITGKKKEKRTLSPCNRIDFHWSARLPGDATVVALWPNPLLLRLGLGLEPTGNGWKSSSCGVLLSLW